MADIEKLKVNLAKNEEKLAKKIALLGKYEAKKEKLSKQWIKLTKKTFEEVKEEMDNREASEHLSEYGFLEKYYGKDVAVFYFDIDPFYSDSHYSNPIISTKLGIKELEDMVQKYKDKIAEEEKKVADRKASIASHTTSVNGKDVNVILEFLNEWEQKSYEWYMNVFEYFEKEGLDWYENQVKDSLEYKIIYKEWENREYIEKNWGDTEYVEYFATYDDYRNASYKEKNKCRELISSNLAYLREEWETMFHVNTIAKYGESTFRPNKSKYETNVVKMLKIEKDRKYDQLILDVESIVGQIFDMTHINVGPKGDLQGYVIGTEGEAELWTTGAGGFNTKSIVNVKHGQIFHFRFYVRRRK